MSLAEIFNRMWGSVFGHVGMFEVGGGDSSRSAVVSLIISSHITEVEMHHKMKIKEICNSIKDS